eukprot:gene26237-34858_t
MISVYIFSLHLILLNSVIGCPFSNRKLRSSALNSDLSFPASCQLTKDAATVSYKPLTCETVHNINASFYSIIPEDPIARTNLLAIAVRVAFHDAGEGDLQQPDTMGSDGCLSSDGDNAGLIEDTSLVMTQIEGLWQMYCDKISRADFWVLTAKFALAATTNNNLDVPFQYGREDAKSCIAGMGRLPAGQFHLKSTANYFKMTLLGAHSLGHVHPEHSGYGLVCHDPTNNNCNAWDLTPDEFDNNYYSNLVKAIWVNKVQNGSNGTLNIWGAGPNILLNADVTLGVPKYGAPSDKNGYDCQTPVSVEKSDAYDLVHSYAHNNGLFINAFAQSFVRLTTVGFEYGDNKIVKFGKLTDLTC